MSHSSFECLYQHGFVRVAACSVPVELGIPQKNASLISEMARRCDHNGIAVAVFPELGLTGYTVEDLFHQNLLLKEVEKSLVWLVEKTRHLMTLCIVGLPFLQGDTLYNCAAIMHRGRLLGIVPKSFLPRYREFYEPRHFSSGIGTTGTVWVGETEVPFGTDLLFEALDIPGCVIGVEICEDLWAPLPPSTHQAIAGATLLANLSASPVTVGRAEKREFLCSSHSIRTASAYIYAAAGQGESTTDLAWDGQLTIHEAGTLCAKSQRFPQESTYVAADIDLDILRSERRQTGYFKASSPSFRKILFNLDVSVCDRGLLRTVSRFPFLPENKETLEKDCFEAWNIQVHALCQRLKASRSQSMIIGVSGGLDSALALLVAVRAADMMGWSRRSVIARTMPGFATGKKSLSYAHELMESVGVRSGVLDIRSTAQAMLEAIEHPFSRGEAVHDVTFENVQAGLRTDFLFRLANHHKGIVIGTGDLSELALGWCTYGVGDQMAHYNVNAGLPKTLIQHVIRWAASQGQFFSKECCVVLNKIVSAEISPELVPNTGAGVQSTQSIIGPYALQDFTLYYVMKYGFSPKKIVFLQEKAWANIDQGKWPVLYPESEKRMYDRSEIVQWMQVFIQRFFATSQFKRSAMPNGPKVVSGGSLSPRGDWRAPSDGNAEIWLQDLEGII